MVTAAKRHPKTKQQTVNQALSEKQRPRLKQNELPNRKIVDVRDLISAHTREKLSEMFPCPPSSFIIDRKKKVLKVLVVLHKIPPQFIAFEPSKTHVFLHTLSFTKKLLLYKSFPSGITVEADENSEAQFDRGVLKAEFAITSELPPFEKKPAAKEVKVPLKRQHPEETVTPPKKKQKTLEPIPPESKPKKNQEPDTDLRSLGPSQVLNMDELPQDHPPSKPSATKSKKKGKVNATDNHQENVSDSKKKEFYTREAALKILDEVNKAEEEIRARKVDKEEAKKQWEERRNAMREEKRKKKNVVKEEQIKAALQALGEKEKEKKEKQRSQRQMKQHQKHEKKVETMIAETEAQSDLALPESSTMEDNPSADSPSSDSPSPSDAITSPTKSILKHSDSKKGARRSVQFSPQVDIKPIPKIAKNHIPFGNAFWATILSLEQKKTTTTTTSNPKSKKSKKKKAQQK